MDTSRPDQWAIRQGVPLVDTFNISRGQVDDHFLDAIVSNFNRRVQETGDYPVLKVTHNGEEVVGFARALRKQPLGNSGRNAVYGDLWLYKDKEDLYKTHPRRSAEIWINQKQLDAVALLGGTAPERDLGLALSKDSDTKLLLSCPNMNDQVPSTGDGMPQWMASLPDAIANKLAGILTPIIMQMGQPANPAPTMAPPPVAPPEAAAPGVPQGAPAPGDPSADGGEGEMNPDELEALIAELEGEQGGQEPDGDEAPPEEDEAEEPEDKKKPKKKKADMELAKEVAALKAQLAEKDLRENLLALSREGYKIEVEDEVKTLMGVDPDTRKILLSRIEKNYPKAPVGTAQVAGLADSTVPTAVDISKDPATREKIRTKMKLERQKDPNYSYEQAYFEITGTELK